MTRNDLLTAKAMLDNLDQLTSAVALCAQQKGGDIAVNVAPFQFKFAVADLSTFLAAQQKKIIDSLLKTYNVTIP